MGTRARLRDRAEADAAFQSCVLAQRSPGQPLLPRALELRFGFFERRGVVVHVQARGLAEHAVQRPEPTHVVGTAALFVDAAHRPLAAIDGEILPVLVDRRRQPGRARGEGHFSERAWRLLYLELPNFFGASPTCRVSPQPVPRFLVVAPAR
jgi:hypothetical protein